MSEKVSEEEREWVRKELEPLRETFEARERKREEEAKEKPRKKKGRSLLDGIRNIFIITLIILVAFSQTTPVGNAAVALTVDNLTPRNGDTINVAMPEISCIVYNASQGYVSPRDISLALDGSATTSPIQVYVIDTSTILVRYKVQTLLSEGGHSVRVFYKGSQISGTWEFTIRTPVETYGNVSRKVDSLAQNVTAFRRDFNGNVTLWNQRWTWIQANITRILGFEKTLNIINNTVTAAYGLLKPISDWLTAQKREAIDKKLIEPTAVEEVQGLKNLVWWVVIPLLGGNLIVMIVLLIIFVVAMVRGRGREREGAGGERSSEGVVTKQP